MENAGRRALLTRMDKAFSDYSHKADQLSVLLAETKNPSSWTSYHELLRQRSIEVVAYEEYRKLKDELFSLIPPPQIQDRPESSVN
jgi:N-dimethylarginine dimethylaminohydrolase